MSFFFFATCGLHTPTQKWAKASEETGTLWHPKDIFVMAPIVETRKIGKEWAREADSNPDTLELESVEGEATSFPNKSSIDLKFPQWWENQKEISVCWLVEMEMCYFGIFRSKWPTGNTRRYLTKKYRETRQAVFTIIIRLTLQPQLRNSLVFWLRKPFPGPFVYILSSICWWWFLLATKWTRVGIQKTKSTRNEFGKMTKLNLCWGISH